MTSRAPRWLAVLATILILAGASLAAQQAAPADTTRAATDSVRAPVIRGEDIPSQADRTAARLRDLEGLLTPDPAVVRIVAQTTGLTGQLDTLIRAQQVITRRLMTRRALMEYSLEWQRMAAEVRGWRGTLQSRLAALQKGRDEVSALIGQWTATIRLARSDSTNRDVLSLAEETLRRARDSEQRIRRRTDELLGAEVRLSEAQLKTEQQLEILATQIAEQRKDLLRIDSPPLWRVGSSLFSSQLLPGLKLLLVEDLHAFIDFVRLYDVRLLLHLVLSILFIRFFRRGQARLASNPDDPLHQEPASVILQRPVAASLLLAALSVLWFYPRAPLIIYDLALLASVAPLIQLRSVLVPEKLRQPGKLVGYFLVAQRLVSLTVSGTDLERIVVFGLSVAGATLLWLGVRPGGSLSDPGGSRWVAIVGRIAKVMLAGFIVATVANAVGNVSLAITTVNTLLLLSYQAMVLVAATRVLDVALSEAVRIGSPHLIFIRTYGPRIKQRGYWLIDAAAVLTWVWLAFFSFYLADSVAAVLKSWLSASWSIGEVDLSLGTVLLFLAVLWIGTMVARFISLVLELDILGRIALPRGVPVTVGSLVRYALVAIAFLTALAATGFKVGQLAIIGGALGVGIGFGLQNIVANFIAGLILAFERPISIGDIIQIADMMGEVKQIGIRASIIRTFDGAEVIVPNSELISREVVNWTRSDRLRRIEVRVGVAYGTDPTTVLQLLLNVARNHPEVAAMPLPDSRFIGFGDSSLDFSLRVWGDFARWTMIQSSVAVAVHEALAEAGISIPFPQRDLHVRSADPAIARQFGLGESTGS